MAREDLRQDEREADLRKMRFHTRCAAREFRVGGLAVIMGVTVYLFTGWHFLVLLVIMGIVVLGSGMAHRERARALRTRILAQGS